VHRSGRTGRAGQKGRSVLLVPPARAARTERLYRIAGIDARWASAPSAAAVAARRLERAEAAAMAALMAGPAATPALRAAAANLLRERDPIEVTAALLAKTMATTREPFELLAPRAAAAPPPARAKRPTAGFARFRINWGTRDGADARRILAHVCRRGEIDSKFVGAIEHEPLASTFDVAEAVADSFAQRVRRRDRRDPHLFIEREPRGARRRAGAGAGTAVTR